MRFLWIDTETTGIDVSDSAPFEIAMILVDNGKQLCQRCFFLNPLSDKIIYHEDAGKINGYAKEDIEKFAPESEEVAIYCKFLEEAKHLFSRDNEKTEKMIFAGYNCEKFDYAHMAAQMSRYGYNIADYFKGIADVFTQVKIASEAKVIPYLENRKLGTLCKHFDINLQNAHDALADITATREVAARLFSLGISLDVTGVTE